MTAAADLVRSHRVLRRYVLRDERVTLATRRHWAILLEPSLTTVGAFVLIALLVEVSAVRMGDRADVLWWLWLIPLGRFVTKFIEWRYGWFAATDKRLLLLSGFVTHRVGMMSLGKVTDLNYSRSVLGEMLGFGEFLLESAGQDQALRRISWVPNPDRNYRALCATVYGLEQPAGLLPRRRRRRVKPLKPIRVPSVVVDDLITQAFPPMPLERDDDAQGVPGPVWSVSEPTGMFVSVEQPTGGHAKPAGGHSRPASGHPEPDGGHSRPADGHSKPAGGHPEPASGHSQPASGRSDKDPEGPRT